MFNVYLEYQVLVHIIMMYHTLWLLRFWHILNLNTFYGIMSCFEHILELFTSNFVYLYFVYLMTLFWYTTYYVIFVHKVYFWYI